MKTGFFALLALLLIGLKLAGYIAISWGWIVLIFLIPVIITIILLVILYALMKL